MNERIKALRGRLPDCVLNQIGLFVSHPTADLMRGVKIKAWGEYWPIAPGMQVSVQEPAYFTHQDPWYALTDRRELRFFFPKWRFATCENLIYIPDWAEEEFLEERVAAWLDR
jgi:hypothetical protein